MSQPTGPGGPPADLAEFETTRIPAEQPTRRMPRVGIFTATRPQHPRPSGNEPFTVRGPAALRSTARDPRVLIGAGIATVLVIALLSYALIPTGTARTVHVAKAFIGNVVQTVATSGELSSGVYNLSFFASGRIAEVDVKVGQQVQSGDVLARLDVTPLQDALTTAKAQVRVAQVAYNNALIALQNAENAQATADAAAQDAYNAVAHPPAGKATPTPQQTQTARDTLRAAQTQAQNAVNAAQSSADLAQSQVDVAQSQETTAEHNLDNADLRAPISGQVGQVNATLGQAVGVNGSNPQPLIVLVNLSTLQLTGQVRETDVGAVQVGWPVNFTVRAFPQFTFAGTVASISPIPQVGAQSVGYAVTIAIAPESASQARLFPQMSAPAITITTQEAIGAVLIPTAAITYARGQVASGRISVTAAGAATQVAQGLIVNAEGDSLKNGLASYVLQWQGGKQVAEPVVLGITDGTYTVVLAGLSSGQPVLMGA
jgi:HlyD family secretion protein